MMYFDADRSNPRVYIVHHCAFRVSSFRHAQASFTAQCVERVRGPCARADPPVVNLHAIRRRVCLLSRPPTHSAHPPPYAPPFKRKHPPRSVTFRYVIHSLLARLPRTGSGLLRAKQIFLDRARMLTAGVNLALLCEAPRRVLLVGLFLAGLLV